MHTTTDKTLLILTALFVGGLAVVAGAISFDHMRQLAAHHGQTGWKSYAFPISVDGLEIVASLYLVVQRRAGRAAGWVPWVALIVGTAASLAANIAVGGDDPIGKALDGWPALSMLIAVKLLSSMLDHLGDDHPALPDDQRPSADRPPVPSTVPDGTGPPSAVPGGTAPGAAPVPPDAGTPTRVDLRSVDSLIPAARTARDRLADAGRSLSRDALAEQMRDDGHGVSNARASLLLQVLRADERTCDQGSQS